MTEQDPNEAQPPLQGAPPPFRIDRESAPEGVALLVLEGEIDLATTGRFREAIDGVLDERVRATVLDVTGVEFMDSTMLRELLRAHRDLQESGSRLIVAGPHPTVRRLLELTGTNEVFEITKDRAQALEGLDPHPPSD
jgi:anti-sigma B factor antagonist